MPFLILVLLLELTVFALSSTIASKHNVFFALSRMHVCDTLLPHYSRIKSSKLNPNAERLNSMHTVWSGLPRSAPKWTQVLVQSGTQVLVQSGTQVLVQSGTPVLVQSGTPVLVQSGTQVLVQSGTQVLVQSGTQVLVQSGFTLISSHPNLRICFFEAIFARRGDHILSMLTISQRQRPKTRLEAEKGGGP